MLVFEPKKVTLAESVRATFVPTELARLKSHLTLEQKALELYYAVFLEHDVMLLELRLKGAIEAFCQRCLKAVSKPFDKTFKYQIIESTECPMKEGQQYEQILLEEAKIDLREVIADEILLSLPLKHEFECELDSPYLIKEGEQNSGRVSPFMALKELCEH